MARVFLRPRALAGIKSAPGSVKAGVIVAIEILRAGKFPSHTKKLEDRFKGYRTRIGRWRVLFVLNNGTVDITDIFLKTGPEDYRRRR